MPKLICYVYVSSLEKNLLKIESRFKIICKTHSSFSCFKEISLVIDDFSREDVGVYTCTATNSFGMKESKVRIYGKKSNFNRRLLILSKL